jgi:multidrug efflux pump subunit AcrA (membrane-fusion protein)
VVNSGGLKIQANLSDAEVALIKKGTAASVTLSAFGNDNVFPATITAVDNAQTQNNGSASYLVVLHFTNAQPQIKAGMTGNVHIVLAENDNVLTIPSQLVINDNTNHFVLIKSADGVEKRPVTIGLVGDTTTEIISGIKEGETLATF